MNKKRTVKNITLSTVLISALVGCGSGSGGGGDGTSSSNKSSLSNLEYDSCVDLNQNLICEDSEKGLNPSDYSDIGVTSKDSNGKYLSGPSGSNKVSASSTLIYNEMNYNHSIDNNKEQAISYIRSKIKNPQKSASRSTSDSSSSLLTKEQSLALEASIKKAVESNPSANRNNVVAAVVEKFLTHQTFVDIESSDIEKQVRILTEVKAELYHKVDWESETTSDLVGAIKDSVDQALVKAQGGEKIIHLHGNGNYQVAASRYHNALTVINYNDSKAHQYEKFAAFRVNYSSSSGVGGTITPKSSSSSSGSVGSSSGGAGSASSGGSASARSLKSVPSYSVRSFNSFSSSDNYNLNQDPNNTKGLWEHLLEQAKITKNGKYVYALIRSKDENTNFSDESTYGFFRTKVGEYGVYPYNHESTLRISSKDIKKFELSNSDNRVVVYGQVTNDKDEKQNILRVLDENLRLVKAIEINNLNDFTITANDKYIVASVKSDYLNKPKLVKYDSATLLNKKQLELTFDVDEVYTYAHGTMALVVSNTDNKIAIVNLESMSLVKEKSIDIDIKLSSLSLDEKYLALASKEKVNIYNLSTPELTFQTSISPLNDSVQKEPLSSPNYNSGEKKKEANYINNLSFVGNELLTLTLNNEQNQILTYKVIDSKVPMSIDNKLDAALLTLDKHSINNGYDFDEIKNNLTLPKSYKDVKFTWNVSGLRTNINLNTGNVKRDPSINLSGRLIARASTTFRNENKIKEKSFGVTILKDAPKVSESIDKFNQLHTLNTPGLMKKVVSNSDGSTIVSFSQLDDSHQGYNLFKVKNNQLEFTQGSESTVEKQREKVVNMIFKNDEKLIVATLNPSYPAFSSLYLQNIDSNTLGSKVGSINIGNSGNPRSVGFSGDKNKVLVIRKYHDFNHADYYGDIYKISGSIITKEKSVRLKPSIEYINANAPAVNEDASVFYQIAKNTIYKHVDSDTITSVRLDNVNAVYYYNNRIYATTTNGLIVSFDKDLSEASKQEFNIGNEASIANLEYKNNTLYAFAEGSKAGVYLISVNVSNEMSASKFSAKVNTKGGTISSNAEHILTFENVPTSYQSNIKSSISYSKAN